MIKDKNYIVITVIYLIAFLLAPIFIAKPLVVFMLLIGNPLLILMINILFTKKMDIIMLIIPILIFAIATFTVYNLSALVYLIAYFIVAVIGNYIGYIINKKK